MRLVAIVTVDHDECLDTDFSRLLHSGREEIDEWFVVLRSNASAAREDLERTLTALGVADVSNIVVTAPCGISKARNAGLRSYLASIPDADNDILCFPDDDCHFSPGFGTVVRERFASEDADLVIMPYAPSPSGIDRSRWPLHISQLTPTALMQVTSSAGIFIRGMQIPTVGGFDEQFGVGGPLAAAEDVDFVLRTFRGSPRIRYWGDIAVLHPYKPAVPTRQLGNFALVRRHRDILPPVSQARAFAKLLLVLKGFTGVRALGNSPLALIFGLQTDNRSVRLRRSVAGLQIDTLKPSQLIEKATGFVVERDGATKSVVAAHITSLIHAAEPTFRTAFNRADISMVDGISLSLISRLTPGPPLEKLATTDFAPAVFVQAAHRLGRPVKVGIIGGEEQVAIQAGHELNASSAVEVVYSTHGYWEEYALPLAEFNRHTPDVLILGLGMPLEAKWLERYQSRVNAPLVITCGGWLRLLAKVEKRAPKPLQKLHMEWLWRLGTDAKRTAPRYSKGLGTVARAIAAPWSR